MKFGLFIRSNSLDPLPPPGFGAANKSVYQYPLLLCGVFFGLSQVTLLSNIANRPSLSSLTDILSVVDDGMWVGLVLAALGVPVSIVRKRRALLRGERLAGENLIVLIRPRMHILGDFFSAAGAVSLFSLISYMIANKITFFATKWPSASGWVIMFNIGLAMTGYQLLRRSAKLERVRMP